MIQMILGIVSLFSGAAFALQSAVNGGLRTVTKNPIFASAASLVTGLLLLPWMLILAHIFGIYEIPGMELLLAETQWWMYTGGTIGVIVLVGSIVIPKKIGFAPYFSLLVAGQLVGSVVADAIGFMGNEVHLPGPVRIAGMICLVVGAVLVQK